MPSILFIDDETSAMKYHRLALKKSNFEVIQCVSPEAGLDYARQHGAELVAIILDIMMPPSERYKDKDTKEGLTTGTYLFDDLRIVCPDAPIIVLTNSQDEDTLNCFPLTPNVAVVQKVEYPPFDLVNLVQTMITNNQSAVVM